MEDELIEALAGACHEMWIHWMKHLFSYTSSSAGGGITLNTERAQRWLKQMRTPYDQLSELEKDSDREIATAIYRSLLKKGFVVSRTDYLA